MKIIEQSHEILYASKYNLELIELAGRTCYKSESKISPDSAKKFAKMLIDKGHHSVIEHTNVTVHFITNRGVTHELVRHRLASYSQESTRYVNYGGKKMEFILPVWADKELIHKIVNYFNTDDEDIDDIPMDIDGNSPEYAFIDGCDNAETCYNRLLKYGWKAQQAREVLPNALKTEIVVTANVREWRHIFSLRTSKAAHPQIRSLMIACLKDFKASIPIIFDDLPDWDDKYTNR